jgi:hypothetical protein
MKYITGNTNKEWYVDGVVFPRKAYTPEAKAKGRNEVICLSDERWEVLKEHAIVRELLMTGAIYESDEPPQTAERAAAIAEQELIRAKAETEKIKAEAIEELRSQAAEIERLKALLADSDKLADELKSDDN